MQEWFDTHPCPAGADLTPEAASTYLQHVSQASTTVGLGVDTMFIDLYSGTHHCTALNDGVPDDLAFQGAA